MPTATKPKAIVCPGLKPGWTDPFHCCVTEQEGRAKKRYYRLGAKAGDMDLPGTTTILGGEAPAYAWASWISQEAQRLFALHNAGIPDKKWEAVWNGTGLEWASEDVDPAELIKSDHLTHHGTRMQGRAADRGNVTELLLADWQELGYISAEDLEHWLNGKLSEYKPNDQPWRCHFDEVWPYAFQLRNFLEEKAVEIKATSVLVIHPEVGYATVVDLWAVIDGELYSLNLKTSNAARRDHAEQIAAEYYASHYIPIGTQEALELEGIRKSMIPGVLLVTETSAVCRRLENPRHWFENFLAAKNRYDGNQVPIPFQTVSSAKAVTA